MTPFGDFQNAIYLEGLHGVLPKVPVDFANLERRATAALPAAMVNYVQGWLRGRADTTTQR